MNIVKNVKGCILRPLGTLTEDFTVRGLLLPKDEISRNGILYDWDSIKSKAKKFEGVPMNYNHIIDDDKPPIGKIQETIILEERPVEEGKWQRIWDIVKEKNEGKDSPGMYYEADIDEEGEYASSIKKGYLNKVSIQVTADGQEEEYSEDGSSYTRAIIGDPLEVSVVKVPGFNATTMEVALAEAFKSQKSIVKNNEEDMQIKKKKLLSKQALEGEFGSFPMDALHKGIKIELKEHPEVDDFATVQLVMDHLKEDSHYYDNEEGMSTATNPGAFTTKIAGKNKEFKIIDMITIMTEHQAESLSVEKFSDR